MYEIDQQCTEDEERDTALLISTVDSQKKEMKRSGKSRLKFQYKGEEEYF